MLLSLQSKNVPSKRPSYSIISLPLLFLSRSRCFPSRISVASSDVSVVLEKHTDALAVVYPSNSLQRS